MTPEQARTLFYDEAARLAVECQMEWRKPIVQNEVDLKAWAKVIEEIERPWKELIAQRIAEDAKA